MNVTNAMFFILFATSGVFIFVAPRKIKDDKTISKVYQLLIVLNLTYLYVSNSNHFGSITSHLQVILILAVLSLVAGALFCSKSSIK